MERKIKERYYRLADVNDIPLIRQLAQATWPHTYQHILSTAQIDYMMELIYSEKALKEQLSRHHCFIVIYEDDQPAGFADYTISDNQGIYKLNKLYLLPAKQQQGSGKALLDEVIRRVKNTGGHTLELNVNRYNQARYFYEKAGFKIFRQVDIPIGKGYYMNDYVMRKKIVPEEHSDTGDPGYDQNL